MVFLLIRIYSFIVNPALTVCQQRQQYRMFYKVELICHHLPHQCRCRHNINTEIDPQDLTSNLIKHNPALLKYLAKKTTTTIQIPSIPQQGQRHVEQPVESAIYRSIVQEKGLQFILKDNLKGEQKSHSDAPKSSKNIPPVKNEQQLSKQTQRQQQKPLKKTSPNHTTKPVVSPREKQLKNLHKNMKNQSRYLSNTGFRKYFDRQCFQNYGNQNVHQKEDGFVYGNYLKTYNINPHTGHNMPNNQETFYHALVNASPQKYQQTQELRLGHTAKTSLEKNKQVHHSLEKEPFDVEKMIEDNLKHNKLQKKYEHIKLKQKNDVRHGNSSAHAMRSQGKPIAKQNINSTLSPKHQLPLQSRKNLPPPKVTNLTRKPELRQSDIRSYNQKEVILANPAQSIIGEAVQCPKVSAQISPKCSHGFNEQSYSCECCLNQMKGLILTLAEDDPDLASRIVTSAKKATLYKNFALDNYEQACMNPHNYGSSGRLNVYQHPHS